MSVEFRRGGQKVSSDQFFKGIKDDIRSKAEQEIEKQLGRIIDPETGRPVKYDKTYRNGEPHWNIHGSREAVERAREVLKRSGKHRRT